MINTVLKITGIALSLWDTKEKRKYMDKYIRLKREWNEAYNAEPRDDASLDNIEFELKLFIDAISSEAPRPNIENK